MKISITDGGPKLYEVSGGEEESIAVAKALTSKLDTNNSTAVMNENGCPCSKDCCDAPNCGSLEHACPFADTKGGVNPDSCEDCYATHCYHCGRTCWCEL